VLFVDFSPQRSHRSSEKILTNALDLSWFLHRSVDDVEKYINLGKYNFSARWAEFGLIYDYSYDLFIAHVFLFMSNCILSIVLRFSSLSFIFLFLQVFYFCSSVGFTVIIVLSPKIDGSFLLLYF
jgi:hypothetical protein